MSDSFINRLDLASLDEIKNTDYTAFDIGDPVVGTFYTKKVTLDTLAAKVSGIVYDSFQTKISVLQNSVNTSNQGLQNKLDKSGTNLSPNEKMTGPLVVNAKADIFGILNVNSNRITNVADPISATDAVNRKYVDALSGVYVPLSGNSTPMTGYLLLNGNPTLANHAANKSYVDSTVSSASGLLAKKTDLALYIPLSGGTMTNTTPLLLNVHPVKNVSNQLQAATIKYVNDGDASCISISGSQMARGYITVAAGYENPSTTRDLVTQQYVDGKVSASIVGASYFVHLSGDTMTGNLILNADPDNLSNVNQATTKNYVDKLNNNTSNRLSAYLPLSGGTVTGSITMSGVPICALQNGTGLDIKPNGSTNNTSVTFLSSGVVDVHNNNITNLKDPSKDVDAVNKRFLDNNFVHLSGDKMTGPLGIKSFSEVYYYKQSSGNVVLSLSSANTFTVDMTGNISGFTFNNEPSDSYTVTIFITQKGTNVAPFSVTNWTINQATVRWAYSKAPVVTKIQNKTDVFCFTKISNDWFGFIGGQNY